jgi:hypothetical protein
MEELAINSNMSEYYKFLILNQKPFLSSGKILHSTFTIHSGSYWKAGKGSLGLRMRVWNHGAFPGDE